MTTAHLVLIDTPTQPMAMLAGGLQAQGFALSWLSRQQALQHGPALPLADVWLLNADPPETQGLALQLRQTHPEAGLLLLSGQNTLEQRLAGLRCGADACLALSVDQQELSLTLRAILRRGAPAQPRRASGWALNPRTLMLTAPDGSRIELTHSETRLLHTAARAQGALVSRRSLIEALGANYWEYDERRLEALISRLRRKLARQAPGLSVRSIKSQGYVFDALDIAPHSPALAELPGGPGLRDIGRLN